MTGELYVHKTTQTLWVAVRDKPLTLLRAFRERNVHPRSLTDRRPTPATLARDYEAFG